MTIFDHKNNKVFGIAIDAGSGLKQALKDARKAFYQENDLETFKKLIITSLGQYATTILIDSEFGPHLISKYPKQCSPMMAFEADVYHISDEDRITKLPDNIKVSDFSRLGYKVLKFFMYYAPNDNIEINEQKQKIIENIGKECVKNNISFLMEPLVYDPIKRPGSLDYAYLKPQLVENATKTFSNPKFNINYLKVEVPVDLSFVEGFGDPIIKQKEAIKFFKDASIAASGIPLLYLSAGVSFEWFKASLNMAIKAEVDCSGFMCGRAIWSEAIKVFGEQGEEGLKSWLNTTGQNRLNELISLFN
jgi:tagatose 1,6-diphosphate aldolase